MKEREDVERGMVTYPSLDGPRLPMCVLSQEPKSGSRAASVDADGGADEGCGCGEDE